MLEWLATQLPPAQPHGPRFQSLYSSLIREMAKQLNVETRVEDSYGQGFASYLDVWMFKDAAEFRLPQLQNRQKHYTGLYVLLCRLQPYFVLGEGAKSWGERGGSSYLPSFRGVDDFRNGAVADLATKAEALLTKRGLTRLYKADLAAELPERFCFDNNLTEGKHRIFDALFFWND